MFTEQELAFLLRVLRNRQTVLNFKYVDDDNTDVLHELGAVNNLIEKLEKIILPA